MARITLPNGCSFTPPTVNPADWKSRSISLKKDWHRKDWYISYRFYDPLFKKEYPNGKLVSVRGMNGYKEYETRKEATENIIEDELYKLRVRGYNPITKQALNAEGIDYEIEPEMPWLRVLYPSKALLQ